MPHISSIAVQRPEKSLRAQVIDGIREAIMSGTLRPGERLSERQLIELTGVSRTSVREALTHLQAVHLVEPSHSRGLQVPKLDRETVGEIYEARAALEPAVAFHFVERATDEEVAKVLETRPGRGDTHPRLESILRMDELLVAGARNSVLAESLDLLRARTHALRRVSLAMPGRAVAADAEIRRICDAIAARDAPGAQEAARDHVFAAREVALLAVKFLDRERDVSDENLEAHEAHQ